MEGEIVRLVLESIAGPRYASNTLHNLCHRHISLFYHLLLLAAKDGESIYTDGISWLTYNSTSSAQGMEF